ncbi:MAG: hypothetical protein ACI8Y7_000097 [Candidatus Woesearchaeota archaeon]|jgi:hypothetical protein
MNKKFIAIFIITLFMTLPFSFAFSLNAVFVEGDMSPHVNEIRGDEDFTYRAILIAEPNDKDTSGNIKPNFVSAIPSSLYIGNKNSGRAEFFTSCEIINDTGSVECLLEESALTSIQSPLIQYYTRFERRRRIGSNLHTETQVFNGTYIVDDRVPELEIIDTQQVLDTLSITVKITDKLRPTFEDQHEGCTPIYTVKAYIPRTGRETINTDVELQSKGCSFELVLDVDVSEMSTGVQNVCVEATDGVDLTGKMCKNVQIDKDAPLIREIAIATEDNNKIEFIQEYDEGFIRFRKTSDTNLNTLTISLNGVPLNILECRERNICVTTEFTLTQGTHTIELYAEDTRGNVADTQVIQTIVTDTAQPALVSLESDVVIDGVSFITRGQSKIVATFDETQSGFHKRIGSNLVEQVLLQQRHSGIIRHANTCTQSNSQWICTWTQFPVLKTDPDGHFDLILVARDDTGNIMTGEAEHLFMLDTTFPQVDATGVTTVGVTGTGVVQNEIVTGDSAIRVTVPVTDASNMRIVGDFTSVGGGSNVTGSCTDTSCTVTSNTIFLSGLQSVTVRIFDSFNRDTQVTTDEIEVLKSGDPEFLDQEFFSHSLTVSPSQFEKTTSRFKNQKAFASIKITSDQGAKATTSRLLSCRGRDGDHANDDSFFSSVNQITTADPSETLLQLELKSADINQEEIRMICVIGVSGSVDGTFIPEEREEVQLDFGTYAFSMGEIGENHEAEVEAAISAANDGIINTIAKLEKFVKIAETLCRLLNLFMTVRDLLKTLGVGFKFLGQALSTNPFTAGAGQALLQAGARMCGIEQTGNEVVRKTFVERIQGVCQFITCERSLTGAIMGSFGDEGFMAGSESGVLDRIGTRSNFQNDDGNARTIEYNDGGQDSGASTTKSLLTDDSFIPRDNLFWNIIDLCIPGIIKNLNRLRQLKCQYAVCVRDDVPQGVPKSACDAALAYGECRFIYQTMFSAFPPFAFFDFMMNKLIALIANPFALAGFIIQKVICQATCESPEGFTYNACVSLTLASELAASIQHIMKFIKSLSDKEFQNVNYCDQL